jgi:hypothetical protein
MPTQPAILTSQLFLQPKLINVEAEQVCKDKGIPSLRSKNTRMKKKANEIKEENLHAWKASKKESQPAGTIYASAERKCEPLSALTPKPERFIHLLRYN